LDLSSVRCGRELDRLVESPSASEEMKATVEQFVVLRIGAQRRAVKRRRIGVRSTLA